MSPYTPTQTRMYVYNMCIHARVHKWLISREMWKKGETEEERAGRWSQRTLFSRLIPLQRDPENSSCPVCAEIERNTVLAEEEAL